jgi:hypothetical protein
MFRPPLNGQFDLLVHILYPKTIKLAVFFSGSVWVFNLEGAAGRSARNVADKGPLRGATVLYL